MLCPSARLRNGEDMRKLGFGLLAATLGACSITTVADRYGNQYGDWYNPGGGYAWQLRLCEREMDAQSVPPMQRKGAMRCCMHDHGVPVDVEAGCGASG
jgi:hypothetical protein